MLNAEDSLVIIIDIQDKLVGSLEHDSVVDNAIKIVNAANTLNIPILVTEQYPKGLGNTVTKLRNILSFSVNIIEKTSFNALLTDGLVDKIKSYNKKQIVIMGIETHICVYQTAVALVDLGYEVYVIKDACASRNIYEFNQGIEAMMQNGVKISCVEIALFEWLKDAKNPKFKEIQALIK